MREDSPHVDQHTTPPDTIDLRDYLRVLARQWRLVAGITVVVVAVALVASLLQTPVYESSTEVAIEPVRSGSDAALEDLLLRDEIVETERRVITSTNVTQRVIDDLGLDLSSSALLDHVNVRSIPNTRVVTISATDTDPQWAAAVANSFATSYLDYRRDKALDEVTAARSNLTERSQELQDEIDAIEDELGPSGADAASSLSPDDQSLVAQREALSQQLAQISIQLAALDPGAEAVRGGGEILVPAEPTSSPVSPRPLRTGVLALVLGLMLGVGAAFLRDHFDDVIRTEDDVKRATGNQPIVGRITTWDDPAADQKLITLVDPFAANSEEFQALAANVRFALLSRAGRHAVRRDGDAPAGRSVAITSPGQAEGKTTVAGNLAVAAAGAGRRVILVGADLRKPTLAHRFGLPDGAGLTDALLNAADLTDEGKLAAHLVDVGIPRLRLLPAGSIPPNPTELLASNQMAWLHNALAGMADLVVYDTPPVLPVADVLELSQHADLTFLVTRAELCHRRDLTHAVERLHGVGAEVGGIVVNALATGRGGYGYGGYYGYGRGTGEYRPRNPADETAADDAADENAGGSFSAVRVTGRHQPNGAPQADVPPPPREGDASRPGAPVGEDDDLDTWLFRNR